MKNNIQEVDGILFIGDPHLTMHPPARRKDENFTDTIFNKLEYLFNLANELSYAVVFLGDMFEQPEVDEEIKTRLMRLLKKLKFLPAANVGNHDIQHATLTDNDSLAVIAESNLIEVTRKTGYLTRYKIGSKIVGIGVTPYGQSFPDDAQPYFSGENHADKIIWLTHHDINFGKPYPKAIPAVPIKNCGLVMNGHMHFEKDSMIVGKTVWMNPGNITRQKIDAVDYHPVVYALTKEGSIKKFPVPHKKGVFDMTGKLIDAIMPTDLNISINDEHRDSEFVNLLSTDSSMEMQKSHNGEMVMEDILNKFERDNVEQPVKDIILQLHKAAVEIYQQ